MSAAHSIESIPLPPPRAPAAFIIAVALFAACNPNSIGRPCVNPNDNPPSGTQISSPALECPSRLCLIQAINTPGSDMGNSRNTCTASCSSDSDCEAETKESCAAGFRCAVATEIGPFCCEKLCICADDLVETFNKQTPPATPTDQNPKPKIITPFACDPKQNTGPVCKPQS
jgi:hypothetical protein